MIEKVVEQVSELLGKDKSGHGMDHVNRVLNLSLKFSEAENANKEIVALTSLLHDVDDYKLFGVENAKNLTNAKMILEKSESPEDIQVQVIDAIKGVGYSKRLKGIIPETLESMIVSDADMCDVIGASGIIRICMYQLEHGKPFFDEKIFPDEDITVEKYKICDDSGVCHIFEKVLRLKYLMLTESGKKEALLREKFTIDFLYHFFEENNVFEWITYLDNFLKVRESKSLSLKPFKMGI